MIVMWEISFRQSVVQQFSKTSPNVLKFIGCTKKVCGYIINRTLKLQINTPIKATFIL